MCYTVTASVSISCLTTCDLNIKVKEHIAELNLTLIACIIGSSFIHNTSSTRLCLKYLNNVSYRKRVKTLH